MNNYYVGKWFRQYHKFQIFKQLELFNKTLKKFKSKFIIILSIW